MIRVWIGFAVFCFGASVTDGGNRGAWLILGATFALAASE